MTLDALNVVLELSESESRVVRANACAALAQFNTDRALARLFELSDPTREREADVRRRAVESLARLSGRAVTARLAQLSDARLEPSLDVRLQAVEALARLVDPVALSRLIDLTDPRLERDKTIRRAAVGALADRQAATTHADARRALLRVSSQDPDPEVRQEALRHLEADGFGSLVRTGGVDAIEYDLLGQLRRSGVPVDLLALPWPQRLALAWQDVRAGLRFEGRTIDPTVPVGVRVAALAAAAFALFAVLVVLGLLTGQTLGAFDSLGLLSVGGILGAAVALASPWFARPSARLPDRLMAAVFESLAVLIRSMPVWAVMAVVVFSVRPMLPAWLATSTPWVLGLAVVGPTVSAVIRLATSLAYGLSQRDRRRWCAQVMAGTLAGAGALGIALGLGTLVLPATFTAADGVKWFLIGLPCCVALAVGFTGVDSRLADRVAVDTWWLRAVTTGFLCAPCLVGVATLFEGWRQLGPVSEIRIETQFADEVSTPASPSEFRLPRGRTVPFRLQFPQEVDIVVPSTEEFLELKLIAGDGVSEIESKAFPAEIRGRHLSEGTYHVLVQQWGGEPTVAASIGSMDELVRLVAGLLHAGAVSVGLSSSAETSDDSGGDVPGDDRRSVPKADTTPGVRVALTPNLRRVTHEELQTALALRQELSRLREEPRTPRPAEPTAGTNAEYAVVMSDANVLPHTSPTGVPAPAQGTGAGGPLPTGTSPLVCAGSVVMSEPVAQGRALWSLVFGWTAGLERSAALQLEREPVVLLRDRPTAKRLEQVRAFNKVFASCSGPATDTILARALRKGATDAVAILERPRWCQGTERSTRGYFYLVTSSTMLLEAGAVVRAVGPARSDSAGVELIDGYGYPASAGEPPHYQLPQEALHCLGSGWEERWLSAARDLQNLSHRDGAEWEHVELAEGREPSPAVPASARFRSGPLDALVAQAGNWIREFDVSADSSVKPPVFDHYFLVADREDMHDCCVDVGAIVRGLDWDGTIYPRFQIVYGWTAGSDSYYIKLDSLARLGSEFDGRWVEYTNELHRRSPNAAQYPLLVDRR